MKEVIFEFSRPCFVPKHLPDTFDGEIVLADLTDIPAEVQGVWCFAPVDGWVYWWPGVGGDLLTLQGGLVADYNVLVSGACQWTIPLPEPVPSEPELTLPDFLTMTKGELLPYLTSGFIKGIWWELMYSYRKALAIRVIKDFTPSCVIDEVTKGLDNCEGIGEGQWERASCTQNAAVRYIYFNNKNPDGELFPSNMYWRDRGSSPYCIHPGRCLNLPVALASIFKDENGLYIFGHSACAIRIGEDTQDFNSWLFFQYHTQEIVPGNEEQMPFGSQVSVATILSISDWVISSQPIAGWNV